MPSVDVVPDVLAQLKPLSFRGISVPCMRRTQRFQQGQVRQHVQDGKFENVASTGPENDVLSYEIPFSQDIVRGGYTDLYLRQLDLFIEACRDKSAGELYDPARGKIRAKCISFEAVLEAQNRGGESVHVDFIDAPELGKLVVRESALASLSGAQTQAGALDAKLAKAKPPEGEDPPKPFINPIRQINGIARQGLAFQGRIASQIDEVCASLESLEDTRKKASDPEQIEINRASRKLRATLQRSKIITDPARVVQDITVATAQTVAIVASHAGLTVTDLLLLNPILWRSPIVKAGTRIKAYKPVG